MALDRLPREKELLRDLGIAGACRDKLRDRALPVGQCGATIGAAAPGAGTE
jgi:hypothetical protein